jgi:hypothetical protein
LAQVVHDAVSRLHTFVENGNLGLKQMTPQTKRPPLREMIYSGRAVDRAGYYLDLDVYYCGGLAYELHCSTRPKHLFFVQALIGDDAITKEFMRTFGVREVKLVRIPAANAGAPSPSLAAATDKRSAR